jgi:hypothetical protein
MASPAKLGQNTVLKKGAVTIALTHVAELMMDVRVLDASVHDALEPSIAKIPGRIDNKLNVSFRALPGTSHATLLADLQSRNTASHNITWPDGSIHTFDAFWSSVRLSAPQDGIFDGQGTLEIDGQPVQS